MRFLALLTGALMLAALGLAGCGGASSRNGNTPMARNGNANTGSRTTTTPPPDNVRRVTITELREALDKGTAVVVDVRSEMQYNQGHIKDAILMPEGQVAARAGELPKDKLLVFYCS